MKEMNFIFLFQIATPLSLLMEDAGSIENRLLDLVFWRPEIKGKI